MTTPPAAERRLLCIGHTKDDLRSLVAVADQAHQQFGWEPIFWITAPGDLGKNARDYIQSKGQAIFDHSYHSLEGHHIRNVYRRFRVMRDANIRLVRDVLDQVRPARVLATVDVANGYFIAEATRAEIPTIYLQVAAWIQRAAKASLLTAESTYHESGMPLHLRLKRRVKGYIQTMAGFPANYWMPPATRIAVQGQHTRNLLIAGGVATHQIAVTGNPPTDWAYTARFGQPRASTTSLYAKLGLPEGTKFFLHCRENYGRMYFIPNDIRQATQVQIIDSLKAINSEIPIVIKLHPREGRAEADFIKSVSSNVIVVEDISIFDLLAESLLVVSTLSTSLIWAAAMDKPTISAFFWNLPEYRRGVADWSGIEMVFTPDQFRQSVTRHLADPSYESFWREKRSTFIKDYLVFDGRCTERLASLVDKCQD